MNSNASTYRLAAAAVLAFAAIIGTIVTLAFSPDPTGGQLQATVSTFGIAIAIALASVVTNGKHVITNR